MATIPSARARWASTSRFWLWGMSCWRYGVASLCWSALTVAFAIAMSLRYYHRLVSVAPRGVVWTLLGALHLVLALPLVLTLLGPLRQRRARTVGDA